jgi:hypothetical protein
MDTSMLTVQTGSSLGYADSAGVWIEGTAVLLAVGDVVVSAPR